MVDSVFMSYFQLMDMNTGLVELIFDAEIVHMFDVHAGSDVIEIFVHTPELVDFDSEWHDNVQINSDKEAFSGMDE